MFYDDIDPVLIGETLRQLRDSSGRTMREVADALGISQSALGMYETARRIPRDEVKILLARYYGVPVESIFFRSKQHDTCVNPSPEPAS